MWGWISTRWLASALRLVHLRDVSKMRYAQNWSVAFAIVLAITLLVGCARVLDYDDIRFYRPGPDSTTTQKAYTSDSCGTITVGSNECADCLNKYCCDIAYECQQTDKCAELAECRLECPANDLYCLHDCGAGNTRGIAMWREYNSCVLDRCKTQCRPMK